MNIIRRVTSALVFGAVMMALLCACKKTAVTVENAKSSAVGTDENKAQTDEHAYMDEDMELPQYSNPVIDKSLPDPTIVRADDGKFYLFATEDTHNVPIMRSANLVDWDFVGTAFTDATRPTFVKDGGIWAPDINKIGKKYVLYYAMSVWGGEWDCGIGRAVSDKPEGPYVDMGKLFVSHELGTKNSIDPFYIEDNGNKYLFWGSFSGIWYIELTSDGLHIKPNSEAVLVAGDAYEGVYIHRHDGMYYLFASVGTCCEGLNSTYHTVVGRSKSLLGPYKDKQGYLMLDNNHEVVVHGSDTFIGTGHNSEIVTDDSGEDWMFYHAFLTSDTERGRVLLLDRIHWRDGWPEIDCLEPSTSEDCPIFY